MAGDGHLTKDPNRAGVNHTESDISLITIRRECNPREPKELREPCHLSRATRVDSPLNIFRGADSHRPTSRDADAG